MFINVNGATIQRTNFSFSFLNYTRTEVHEIFYKVADIEYRFCCILKVYCLNPAANIVGAIKTLKIVIFTPQSLNS